MGKIEKVGDEIDLHKYWGIIRRRKWSIISLSCLVTLLATLVVYSLTPYYRATSTLLIEAEVQKSLSPEAVIRLHSQSKEYYLTQLEVLKSRRLAGKVAVSLGLDKDPDFLPKKSKPNAVVKEVKEWLNFINNLKNEDEQYYAVNEVRMMDVVVSKLLAGLSVSLIRDTQLVQISYQSDNPALAVKVVNALVDSYIEDLVVSRVKKARLTTDWMGKRLLVLKQLLLDSDQALQAYRERHGLIDIGGVNTLTVGELRTLTNNLLTSRSKYNELKERYGSKHPKFIVAYAEFKQAKQELTKGKVKIQGIARKAVKLREYQAEVETNKVMYESFLNRYHTATQSIEMQNVNARVNDYAVMPSAPFKPKKTMLVTLAFLTSLMFGVFLTFLHDFLDKTFKTVEDIESKLNVPILGMLPLHKENMLNRKGQVFAMLDRKQTTFAESMRTIRTGLVLSSLDNPHKIFLVTSSIPGEGKTVVSTNLAISMATMEKVLLIGGDLRRPTLSRAVGLVEHKMGISSIIAGTADFKDCIYHVDEAGIDVLPCGIVPPNPLELLSSKRFAKMLEVLEKHYDRIVIDSPPVQAVSDALVLSKYAKAVVYVIEADSTHEHAVMNGINRLLEHGAPLAGVILNKFDVSEGAKYDYNSGGYYDLYGYSESTT